MVGITKMTDDELQRTYESAIENHKGHAGGLRAVFEAGARAQRDMPITEEISAAMWVHSEEGQRPSRERCDSIYRAMQRAAPLAKVDVPTERE